MLVMWTLRSRSIPITFIFPIFIIQCLLLDGLLCYQYDGRSNPPSPRQDANSGHVYDDGDKHLKPSSWQYETSGMWNPASGGIKDKGHNGAMPSHFQGTPQDRMKREPEEATIYPNNKIDITKYDRRPRYHHQTGPSHVGDSTLNNHPPGTPPMSTLNGNNINHGKRHFKRQRKDNNRKQGKHREIGRYRKLSNKDIYKFPTPPFVPNLVDSKTSFRGKNRYEKVTDTYTNKPISHQHLPSSYSHPAPHDDKPSPSQSHHVPDEDWDRLLRIQNVPFPAQITTYQPSSHQTHPQSSQISFHAQPPRQNRKSSERPEHFPSKRSPYHPLDEMYQADEPESHQLEAYIEALHHIDEMETCSAARCKDPQPFVHYMHDSFNENKVFFPHCTILHRCMNFTGCCGDTRLECVPKKTMIIRKAFIVVDLTFFVRKYVSFKPSDARMIELVNHTECECREKPKHRCLKQCPIPFKLRHEGQDCFCDCHTSDHVEEKHLWECEKVEHGVTTLSIDGLVCIKEDNCYKPKCIVGNFDVKTGFCPLSDAYALPRHMFRHDEERRRYRKHLNGFGFTSSASDVSIKVTVTHKEDSKDKDNKQIKSTDVKDRKSSSELHKVESTRLAEIKNKYEASRSKYHTVHGASYDFNKQNIRNKQKPSHSHSLAPQPLTMPKRRRMPKSQKIKSSYRTSKSPPRTQPTDIAPTMPTPERTSKVPSSSTANKFPSPSVASKSPIPNLSSANGIGYEQMDLTLDSLENDTLSTNPFASTSSSQQSTTMTTSSPSTPMNASLLYEETPPSSTNSPHYESFTQQMLTKNDSLRISTARFTNTLPPDSNRNERMETRDNLETNDRNDNHGSVDISSEYSSNSDEQLQELEEKDSLKAVEDESIQPEGSGSDAEN